MNVISASRDVWDEDYRRAVSRELIDEFPALTVDEDGYLMLPKGTIEGYLAFQRRVRQLFQERLRADGMIEFRAAKGGKKAPKRYLQPLFRAEDYVRYPELLALGLNRNVIAAVSRYLGTLPVLRTIEVFWTPPSKGDEPEGSQHYHFDHDDYRELKLFFYIDDMDQAGGPFTFLPKSVSDRVTQQATAFKGKRYADEEVYRFCKPSDAISFTGPAGTGAVVDTSNCMHYGGRADGRGRLMVMHHYLRPKSNVIAHGFVNLAEIPELELDAFERMVVAVPPWAKLEEVS